MHITAESETKEAIDINLKELAIKTEYEPKILKVVLKQKVISPDLSPRTQRSNDDNAFKTYSQKQLPELGNNFSPSIRKTGSVMQTFDQTTNDQFKTKKMVI